MKQDMQCANYNFSCYSTKNELKDKIIYKAIIQNNILAYFNNLTINNSIFTQQSTHFTLCKNCFIDIIPYANSKNYNVFVYSPTSILITDKNIIFHHLKKI